MIINRLLVVIAVICLAGCSSYKARNVSGNDHPVHNVIGEGFEQVDKLAGRHDERIQMAWRKQLEGFTKDDNYACRRPLYARYFNQGQLLDAQQGACPEEIPFHLTNGLEADEIVWLSPDKVHAVHLLFIGQGEAMMSKFGHIAFRLIICP